MILVDKPHELFKSVLGLQSLLLRLPMLVGLLLIDRLLVFVTFLRLIEPDLNGYEITIHAMDHVLALAFDHLCLVVLVLDLL